MDDATTTWCIAQQLSSEVRELASALRMPPLVARVLINRGLRDEGAAGRYLRPMPGHLESPFAFRQMNLAVNRILGALQRNERILVQGDYDVDGSASAALLVNLFRMLGAQAEASIPVRAVDGYGLNERVVREAAQKGVKLLITCDNGTTAVREVSLARELGIDTIITDHHTVPPELPPAYALLNPHVAEETLAFRDLCGAGVAFKLALGILERAGGGRIDAAAREFLHSAQSLVALAAIADVVPLRGENRVFARFGLGLMPDSANPGIRALMEVASLTRVPTGTDVGFKLAPRLNAGGRMGRETLALEILTAPSYGEAMKLVQECDVLNRKRQQLDRELTKLASDIVRSDSSYEGERVLVVGHEDFQPGVVGIVAARLTETFNKPAVLVAFNGDSGRGSGRSVPGFHLYNALNECAHLMKRFGGHEQAAGLEITRENFGMLRRAVNEVADKHVLNANYASPTLDLDAEVSLSELTLEAVDTLALLEPFGEGNPEPQFCARSVEVVAAPKVVGRGTGHLSLLLRQGGGPALRAIGFGLAALAENVQRGDRLRIAFSPIVNDFRGARSVEVSLKAIRPE